MATYLVLCDFTDQGIRNVTDTTKRADAMRQTAKKFGVTVKEIYWTLGAYDIAMISESSDESAATALALALGQQGNVRTQVMRAFGSDEMKGILAKLSQVKAAVPA